MIKWIRDGIADSLASLAMIFPASEAAIRSIGGCLRSVPLLNRIYPRFVATLCKKLGDSERKYRLIRLEGKEFLFDITDFTMSSYFFHGQVFENDTVRLLSRVLKEGDTVLDVGANRGYLTLQAAMTIGQTGQVYSFEPNPKVFADLQKHVAMNRLEPQVALSQVALSDSSSNDTRFYLSNLENNSGLSSLSPLPELLENRLLSDDNTIAVQTIRLDEWLLQNNIDKQIDLIKVDVEGAEMQVLRGATNTLLKSPPKRWLIETRPESEVAIFLKGYGYGYELLDRAGDHANFLFSLPSTPD